MRIKRGLVARKRHRKILRLAKGMSGRRRTVFRLAKQAVIRAGQYSYRDRRTKKRSFRRLWIARLNAAVRGEGLRYSEFIHGLRLAKVSLDRKTLQQLAERDHAAFVAVIEQAKSALKK